MKAPLLEISKDQKIQKKKNPVESDTFLLFDDYIEVTSKSGSKYEITLDHCTCKGYGFHRECRHYEKAKQLGLISKLQTSVKSNITISNHSRKMRKDAIQKFLTKYNINFTQQIIDKIESILTSSSTAQQILSIANNE